MPPVGPSSMVSERQLAAATSALGDGPDLDLRLKSFEEKIYTAYQELKDELDASITSQIKSLEDRIDDRLEKMRSIIELHRVHHHSADGSFDVHRHLSTVTRYVPPSSAQTDDEEGDDGEMIGSPKQSQPSGTDGSGEDGSDDELDDEPDDFNRIPLSNEIVLKGHTKVISAVAVDHSGSRVLSGNYDYTVRMCDFQGMNPKLQSFGQLEPFEGHQVLSLSWSPTSDRFLCVTGSTQAKIYDRDGLTLGKFIKGGTYIRDLKNTKGHISELTGGEWNPKSKETILTSSEDDEWVPPKPPPEPPP